MRVRWTQSASRDLTQICDYIQEHQSGDVARRAALSIYHKAGSLSDFPESGRPGRRSGTRELVLTNLPYIVIYRIHANTIEILRVLHGAQQWPDT